LKAAAALHNRGGPRRTDAEATSTLLDDGYVFCAECGLKMTRYWHIRSKRPYYQCNKAAGVPRHPHRPHHIPAPAVDALALRLLARVLTDPEKILELADAAESQLAAAETDAALAEANLAAHRKRLAEIRQQQDELLVAQDALSKVRGMEKSVADIRAQLARLDQERQEAEAARAAAPAALQPRHGGAGEAPPVAVRMAAARADAGGRARLAWGLGGGRGTYGRL